MKLTYAKGFYAIGLICMTLQVLMYLFKYVVEALRFTDFIAENWSAVAGYILLMVLFLRSSKIGTDVILTVIGMLLWVIRFVQTFTGNLHEPVLAFLMCAAGIFGVVFVFVGLLFDVNAMKKENKDK